MFIIDSASALEEVVLEFGFLPFFKNHIKGFSVEEMILPELWFSSEVDGPWEWKGPIAGRKKCVYGKFFRGKAGFVSLEWFPHFANYRRDGYDMDSRYDDGLAPASDLRIWNEVISQGSVLSKELKRSLGYGKDGHKGFDTAITRLQMQTYININAFDYMTDKNGNKYGWGVARYSTPEFWLGEDIPRAAYSSDPKVSFDLMVSHLCKKLPDTDEKSVIRLIKL